MAGSAGEAGPGRRSRQAVARPRLVKFLLSEEVLSELYAAAQRAGLARAAFVAGTALVAARGGAPGAGSPVREALVGTDDRGWAGAPGRNESESGRSWCSLHPVYGSAAKAPCCPTRSAGVPSWPLPSV